MSIFFAVDRYRVSFLGKHDGDAGGKVVLYLFEEGEATYSAVIEFHPQEDLKDRGDQLDPLKRPRGMLPESLVSPVLDVLRHERPVYFSWSAETGQVRLDTGCDPLDDDF